MRASSKASKPHSYGESFSRSGRRGPRNRPTSISVTPIPVATIRNSRDGKYSASTAILSCLCRRACRRFGMGSGRESAWRLARQTNPLYLQMVPKRGLEPYDLRRYHLKVVRLPIPPPGQTITSDYLPDAPRIVTGFSVSGSLPKAFLHQKPKIPPEPAHSPPEPGRPGPHRPSERPAVRPPEPPARWRRGGHQAQILVGSRAAAVSGIPGHEETDAEEHHGQPLGRLGQEVRGAARTEHRAQAPAPKRTCRRTEPRCIRISAIMATATST